MSETSAREARAAFDLAAIGGTAPLVAFVPTLDPARARAFYEGILGLRFVSEDDFALVLSSGGITVRIANVGSLPDFRPAPYTILGWHVPSAEAAAAALQARGVPFERYEGMEHDALGIWKSPSGARVGWFKDPDGNVLSVTEY
jgi:catechol 2,3-dioxygenase-like lactoylglutathione lyase family enzyme